MSEITTTLPNGNRVVTDYTDAGLKSYANIYSRTGVLLEQDGFDPDGHMTVQLLHGSDGRIVGTYYGASGVIIQQEGFDGQGHRTYLNLYSGTGTLLEQDGYDANGRRTVQILHGSDGRTVGTYFSSDGRLIQQEGFDGQGHRTYLNLYGSAGTLSEQTGYDANGLRTVLIKHETWGGTTTTYFAADEHVAQIEAFDGQGRRQYINVYGANGALIEQNGYDANGVMTVQILHGSDGRTVGSYFAPDGHPTQQEGFDAQGRRTYLNLYGPTGLLSEQNGYDAAGHLIYKSVADVLGGSQATTYDTVGRVLAVNVTAPSGVTTSVTQYAGDGSVYVESYHPASGVMTEQSGYDPAGHRTYTNLYVGGVLAEQDSFYLNGQKRFVSTIAQDGSHTELSFDPAGLLTERALYDASGRLTSATFHHADGTSGIELYSGGVIASQTLYDALGGITRVETYDAGRLSGRDTFDGLGHKLLEIRYAADGTTTESVYDLDGVRTYQNQLDAQGRIIVQDSLGATGVVTLTYMTGVAVGPALNLTGLRQTFADEFNVLDSSPDGSRGWQSNLGFGVRDLQNNELEYFSDSSVGVNPFSIANGILDVTARRAAPGDTPAGSGLTWTSGALTTIHNFSQTYGVFEIRAKLPAGQGMWPSFWMLPADGSAPPELDIFEVLGDAPSTLYMSTHSKVNGNAFGHSDVAQVADTSAGFHTYSVDWEPDTITWYFDGQAMAVEATPVDMHVPMYMIIELAIGGPGSWPGAPADSQMSGTYQVDYVRAYATANTVAGNSLINGTSGNDVLTGQAGDDTFTGLGGNDTIDGGGGHNTVVYPTAWQDTSLVHNANGSWTASAPSGVSSLANVQTIRFSNGSTKLLTGTAQTSGLDGKLVRLIAFAANGQPDTATFYDSAGHRTKADAYDSSGIRTAVTLYDAAGTVTDVSSYSTAGIKTGQHAYYPNGTSTIYTFDATTGTLTRQEGYDPGGHRTYANLFTAGVLTEQDAFDSAGNLTFSNILAPDGSSVQSSYSGGFVVEVDLYNPAGQKAQVTVYASDRSSYVTVYDTGTGQITEQDGYRPNGVKQYTNLYTAGRLFESDGYDTSGHKIFVALYAADGSSIESSFTTSGALSQRDAYDAAHHRSSSTTINADGTSAVTTYEVTTAQATRVDYYDAAGHKILSNIYSGGVLVEQDGFNSSGFLTYRNLYSAGVLVEQDGYDGAGHLTQAITHAGDGSSITRNYDTGGALSSQASYNAQGTLVSTISKTANGYAVAAYHDSAVLSGTAFNDVFTGGGLGQTFSFSGAIGADQITNFRAGAAAGHDMMSIDHALLADYATLIAHTQDVGPNALITIDGSNSILLQGIHKAALLSSDFHFV